jgi:HAD superfamily hydrolase (TIGR01509 family)
MPSTSDRRRKVRGVIFDVDGTLINSNDAHARAWVTALEAAGASATFQDVRPLIGMGGDKIIPQLLGVSASSELGERVSRQRAEVFARDYLPQLKPFPKTRELLTRLRERGLRLAVASSAQENELSALLELAKVADLLQGTTSSTDATSSKPDPDVVQGALGRLALPSAHVLMVGDTPYDIEAAARADVDCIGFRCGGYSDADLAGALAVYDGPGDLLEQLANSPLGDTG